MTTKFKILSSVSFIALAIVLTFVGVWALTDLDFTVGGNITYTAPKPSITLYWDSANSYWYVKMGSTDTISEIKWRLVGLDGERYTSSTKPTSGQGTFILETYVSTTNSSFNASTSDGNDYATSDIREYLKGDYVTALNLANDETYKAIDPRSASELYQNMAWRTDDANQIENCSLPTGTYDTTEDSLWLMSVAEIYTLVGGGTITHSTIDFNWEDYWNELAWDYSYWLRTPYPFIDFGVVAVEFEGYCNGFAVVTSYALRPAFNLVF